MCYPILVCNMCMWLTFQRSAWLWECEVNIVLLTIVPRLETGSPLGQLTKHKTINSHTQLNLTNSTKKPTNKNIKQSTIIIINYEVII